MHPAGEQAVPTGGLQVAVRVLRARAEAEDQTLVHLHRGSRLEIVDRPLDLEHQVAAHFVEPAVGARALLRAHRVGHGSRRREDAECTDARRTLDASRASRQLRAAACGQHLQAPMLSSLSALAFAFTRPRLASPPLNELAGEEREA